MVIFLPDLLFHFDFLCVTFSQKNLSKSDRQKFAKKREKIGQKLDQLLSRAPMV